MDTVALLAAKPMATTSDIMAAFTANRRLLATFGQPVNVKTRKGRNQKPVRTPSHDTQGRSPRCEVPPAPSMGGGARAPAPRPQAWGRHSAAPGARASVTRGSAVRVRVRAQP